MQFAGQRTDMELNPIGEPVNALIKLTPDVVPEPDAVLITGITPQQTLVDGYTEAEFLKFFYAEVVQPDTIFVGYNSIRFDDEFMRFLHYRNFYDPYEWHYQNNCSKWDLLDVVRMTRALRPEGIEWPFAPDGKPTNRLEYLTSLNKLEHIHAHDALSDVLATIAVAKLIKTKQPELFKYLLEVRDKIKVSQVVQAGQPFVYTSGRYPSATLHTSAAVLLSPSGQGNVLIYNLRHDPTPFLEMSVDELIAAWQYSSDPTAVRLPVKTLKFNRCPAVAPLGVIKDQTVQDRLELPLELVTKHLAILKQHQADFTQKILAAVERLDASREQTSLVENPLTVDERLYEKFFDNADKQAMRQVRSSSGDELEPDAFSFHDDRLQSLLPLYKARNYPKDLSTEERAAWDDYCYQQVFAGDQNSKLANYFKRLAELAADTSLTDEKKYLLEELQLYGQSIVPADAAD